MENINKPLTYQQISKCISTISANGHFNNMTIQKIHSAVDKQIPMTPQQFNEGSWDIYRCPKCHNGYGDGKFPYCRFCGQALDWGCIE